MAQVMGWKLYEPDPKDLPGKMALKVELELQPLGEGTRASKAVLHVDLEHRALVPIGSKHRLTLELAQEELPFTIDHEQGEATVTLNLPGRMPVTATMKQLDLALATLDRKRGRAH